MYLAYSLLLALAGVILFPFFLIQGLRKGKYLSSFRARLGRVPAEVRASAAPAGAKGDAIWLHAVSVGEVLACQGLAAAIKERFPRRPLLVSTTTETGMDMARRRLRADGFFYCPFDFAFSVRRVLHAVRPALLVVAETEFWPNLFYRTWRAGLPIAVVNTRISDRSFPRYRRFRFFFTDVLRRASLLMAQSPEDARRLRDIGASESAVRVTGNLKYDQCRAAQLPEWLDCQVRGWAANGALVAGSTAAGEEAAVLSAFKALRGSVGQENDKQDPPFTGRAPQTARHPTGKEWGTQAAGSEWGTQAAGSEWGTQAVGSEWGTQADTRPLCRLRLILAPRRPERFDEVAELAVSFGFGVARRSELVAGRDAVLRDSADVLLLDTIGELSGFYRYATVAFIGGSLVPHGGQNILEAAQFARPVVTGPYMSNFREMTETFRAAGALRQIRSTDELLPALQELFTNPALAHAMGESARRLLELNRGATARTVELLASLLDADTPGTEKGE